MSLVLTCTIFMDRSYLWPSMNRESGLRTEPSASISGSWYWAPARWIGLLYRFENFVRRSNPLRAALIRPLANLTRGMKLADLPRVQVVVEGMALVGLLERKAAETCSTGHQ
jgi:hypothetical protein